jgi:hypothetical protein
MIDLYEERLRFSLFEDLQDPNDDPNDRRACHVCEMRECDLPPRERPLVPDREGLACWVCKRVLDAHDAAEQAVEGRVA